MLLVNRSVFSYVVSIWDACIFKLIRLFVFLCICMYFLKVPYLNCPNWCLKWIHSLWKNDVDKNIQTSSFASWYTENLCLHFSLTATQKKTWRLTSLTSLTSVTPPLRSQSLLNYCVKVLWCIAEMTLCTGSMMIIQHQNIVLALVSLPPTALCRCAAPCAFEPK